MPSEEIQIGDSVLAHDGGNVVPGVAAEVNDDRVLVTLAEPYVDEQGEPNTERWFDRRVVTKILDDADAGSGATLPG